MTQDTGVNAIPRNDRTADRTRRTITITGPASYTTGGDTISLLNDLGLGSLHMIAGNVAVNAAGTACRIVGLNRADPANPKLLWFDQAFAEIANGVDLSTFTIQIEFIGQ